MTTAMELAATLVSGRTTPNDIVATTLAAASGTAAANVFLATTPERAVLEAEGSARRHGQRLSPLDGVPIAWKDLFDVAGTVTTSGSAACSADPPAPHDSLLVRRAATGGLVTVGKTNLSEFAFSGLGINDHFGTPANPLDPALVPGGSSCGSAVAVARGIVSLAVGTDTSGSVRVPAAYCGVTGYRASVGRYGAQDFAPLSTTLDSVGFFAETVADIVALDGVFGGRPATRSLGHTWFVIPTGEWSEDIAPRIAGDFESVVDTLREAGFRITRRPLPSMAQAQDLMDGNGTIVGAEAYRRHHRRLGRNPPIQPSTERRLRANAYTADTIAIVYDSMDRLRRQFVDELDGACLLCPTVRRPPCAMDDITTDSDRYDKANADALRTTMLLSYLGTCGISLPLPCAHPGCAALLSRPQGKDVQLLADAARIVDTR